MSEREGPQRERGATTAVRPEERGPHRPEERALSERAVPRVTSVAIVGLGSRGLSVLERIVTLAKRAGPSAGEVHVELVDPSCAGAGVHDTAQPDYLLLNTTCGQVSMFPDACTVGDEVDRPGPSLHEWVTERGLRLAEDGFTVGPTGRPIRPTDFLPRRVLGEYLGWFLDQVRLRAPGRVRLTTHRAAAVDISAERDGSLVVALSDGTRVPADYAFLTTGYTPNDAARSRSAAAARTVPEPYPLPERVAELVPGESVAIGGFGLSAMDLMSALTVGRGGRLATDGPQLRYLPSGLEPTLLFYSRSGVPCRARPLVVEFGPRYRPLVFTAAAIDALRAVRGGPLDFDRDVLPLVLTEVRVAYRRCEARCAGADAERDLERELTGAAGSAPVRAAAGPAGPAGIGAVLDVLDDLDARLGRFDPAAAFDGSAGMLLDDSAAYQAWLADVLRRDLEDGLLGFTRSPLKAALDIFRDLRDLLRHAVDFGGLTAASLDAFIGQTVPAVNRAVVGPQYERHTELLALMAAGIAKAPFGPAPTVSWAERAGRWTVASSRLADPYARQVDWLVSAHVDLPGVDSSGSPLLRALRSKGWIRPHRPASRYVQGIDVDRDQHPLTMHGQAEPRLWVLGPLCEGATYYNNLVPSPGVYSRPIFDAHRCVTAMFAAARAGAEPELEPAGAPH